MHNSLIMLLKSDIGGLYIYDVNCRNRVLFFSLGGGASISICDVIAIWPAPECQPRQGLVSTRKDLYLPNKKIYTLIFLSSLQFSDQN